MSNLKHYHYDGFGQYALDNYHYSQAVRLPPNRIECAGQGGWDPKTGSFTTDRDKQIDRAFENADLALKTAGVKGGWKQV